MVDRSPYPDRTFEFYYYTALPITRSNFNIQVSTSYTYRTYNRKLRSGHLFFASYIFHIAISKIALSALHSVQIQICTALNIINIIMLTLSETLIM